jgi:hypothetical protein
MIGSQGPARLEYRLVWRSPAGGRPFGWPRRFARLVAGA